MPSRCLPLLPLLLALAACDRALPPTATAPAKSMSCLTTLPATPLVAPAAALYQQEFAATPLDAAGLRCLGQVFGEETFATPLKYDPAYAPVQAAHGEDAHLHWSGLAHQRVQLLRISQGPTAATWLLRIDTGLAMEGGRYDLLFTSDAQGRLREHLLVGAGGVRYQRNLDLRSPNQFSLNESGGREQQAGRDYRAAFHIDDDGHLMLDPAGTTTPLDAAAVNSSAEPGSTLSDSATSLEQVDGAPGDAEAIRRLLFSDSGVIEENVQRHDFADGSLGMLALGRIDEAGLLVYVFRPLPAQPEKGRTHYHTASISLPAPEGVLSVELGKLAWKPAAGGVTITLPLRYALLQPGTSPDSGEAATGSRDVTLQLQYDLGTGELRRLAD